MSRRRQTLKTVQISSLTASGERGEGHFYTALLDGDAINSAISRRVVKGIGARILRCSRTLVALIAVEDAGQRRAVLATVSDAQARAAEPAATVIFGRDYLQPLRLPSLGIAQQQWRPGWHHHAFSKRCRDEVHGRFDAALGDTGFEVQDVGAGVAVAYAGSGIEAIEIAEALAAEWHPPETTPR